MAYSEDMEDEQQTAFNPNQQAKKFNKFNALQQTYQQSKGVAGAPGALAKQNVMAGTNQAQQAASQKTAQQGTAVKQNIADKSGAYVIGAAPTTQFNVNTNPGKLQESLNYQSQDKGMLSATSANNKLKQYYDVNDITSRANQDMAALAEQERLLAEQNQAGITANEGYRTAEQQRLDDEMKAQSEFLASQDQSGMNISATGDQNMLERESEDLNRVLANDPTSNIGGLAALYKNYNSGRLGGLDSQIYNDELQKAKDDAQGNLTDQATESRTRQSSIERYLKDLDEGRDSSSEFGTTKTKELGDTVAAKNKELADLYGNKLGEINAAKDGVGAAQQKALANAKKQNDALKKNDKQFAKEQGEMKAFKEKNSKALKNAEEMAIAKITEKGPGTTVISNTELKTAYKKGGLAAVEKAIRAKFKAEGMVPKKGMDGKTYDPAQSVIDRMKADLVHAKQTFRYTDENELLNDTHGNKAKK